jgi:hypothetical protein
MTTMPWAPMASTAARVLDSSSVVAASDSDSVYIGTPLPPRFVISLASASSARLRAFGSWMITAATTLAPFTCIGWASGSFQVDSKTGALAFAPDAGGAMHSANAIAAARHATHSRPLLPFTGYPYVMFVSS